MREPRGACVPALWVLGLALLGCGDEGPPAPVGQRGDSPEVVGEAIPASPPGPSDDCARDLAAGTPAPVRATLDDLGYAAVFDDACLAQRAELESDPAICETLSVATLRDRCAVRVAVSSGQPSACPEARTIAGRDPLCVALAARDRRLCAVASVIERAVCQTALGREGACAHLPESEREHCAVRAADLASRVQGEPITRPALATSMTLTLEDGTTRTPTSADRGARITYRGCARVLVLADQSHLTAPFGLPGVAFELVLPDEEPIEASLTSLPSQTASTLSATLDGMRVLHANAGTLSLTRLEPQLGGVVEGTFHATFSGETRAIEGAFTTFVRDVDAPGPTCAPTPASE